MMADKPNFDRIRAFQFEEICSAACQTARAGDMAEPICRECGAMVKYRDQYRIADMLLWLLEDKKVAKQVLKKLDKFGVVKKGYRLCFNEWFVIVGIVVTIGFLLLVAR